jgi:hypothetical protein
MFYKLMILGWLLLLTSAACRSQPTQRYTMGELLLQEDFSQAFGWDAFTFNDIQIGVRDGVYEMRSNVREYVRGFNERIHRNVVIEVESRQFSSEVNNAYGVVCRASPGNAASGYYFLIGADGTYSIRRGRDDQVEALVSWNHSSAINAGTSKNIIRAICADDYLALYVNGDFVADAYDNTFKSGFAGFAVAVSQAGDIDVTFDNLKIWNAAAS